MTHFEIVETPIQIEQVQQKVVHRNAGAITLFIGTVREMTKGKQTLQLTYDAYKPMAIRMFEKISKEISFKWPDAQLAITHRIGTLQISDIAVVIASLLRIVKRRTKQMNTPLSALNKLCRFGKKKFGQMGQRGLAIS